MIQILYIIGQLGFGGAERQLLYLVQRLDRSKYRPVICVLSAGIVIPEFQSAQVPIVILKRHLPRFDATRVLGLLRLIRERQPDLIHSSMMAANVYACLAGMITRVPVIASERSADPHFYTMKHAFDRGVERLLIPHAARLIANSWAGADIAVRRTGIEPGKVEVIYNGVDLTPFDEKRELQKFPSDLVLRPGVSTIGLVGSINECKDYGTFLHAMKLLRLNYRGQFHILCVGAGPELNRMQELAKDFGLGQCITFTGLRTDVPEIMPGLDVLVSSSRWEGLPNVVMEAMAAGKPVVATAVGGTPELVLHGSTGFLVPPQAPDQMAAAVQKILENPNIGRQMGKAGRKRIEQCFRVEQMVCSTENVYQRLLAAPKRGKFPDILPVGLGS
jgi:glycosyltransferase involved in cell wall biosynthesis